MQFPPVLVINLDERKDRWNDIQKAFTSWPIKLERISAMKQNPGWRGCLQSHKKAIRYAMERQYPWVLVLEDDCFPAKGEKSFQQFFALLPILWEARDKWELFSGGPTFLKKQTLVKKQPPLFYVQSFCAHFVLIHSGVYQKILNINDEEPIDILYKNNMQCLCTYPHIAYQNEGMSNIEGKKVNYKDAFEISSRKLMHELYGYQYDIYFGFAVVLVLLTLKAITK